MAHTATAHPVRMATVPTVRPLITATVAIRRRAVTAQHPAGILPPLAPTPRLAVPVAVALTVAPVDITQAVGAVALMEEVVVTVAEVADTTNDLSNFGPLRNVEAGHSVYHRASFATSSFASTTLLLSPC
jgi:hypothetical protein